MKKRISAILCVLAILMCTVRFAAPVSAYSAGTYGVLEYAIEGGSVNITGCGMATSVTIPSTIEGYPVTTISGGTLIFRRSGITSITIPNGVTSISICHKYL